VATGFRTLFNMPHSVAVIKRQRDADYSRYWENVLDYCIDGNLQSVMDEYVHVLHEALGLLDMIPNVAVYQLTQEVQTAISIRTVTTEFDEIKITSQGDRVELKQHRLRCRYALRFRNSKGEEE
jgi:hypothetical protein